jgi:predicted metal-dependent peptidase
MRIFTPEEMVQQARLTLVTEFVFFGSIFLRLRVFEDPTCDTAYTDGSNLGYNMAYITTLDNQLQVVGLFVHEVLHVALKHHLRLATNKEFQENFQKFNRAADYALNPIIEKTAGMEVNPNWLLDMQRWEDELVETIFKQLPDDPSNDKTKGGDQPGNGKNGAPVSMPGEVRPFKNGKPVSKAEENIESNKIDQWVQAAGMKSKGVGRFGGNESRLIKKIVTPKVYWGDELQHLLDEMCKNDYTWVRPNVRYIRQGIYLPSMGGKKMVDLVIFVDTSGSLSNKQLSQIMSEIRTIVAMFNVRITVVYWDTRYQHHEEFTPYDVMNFDFALDARGGGGTNFADCWEWLDEQDDIDPRGIIFFTDCECSRWPEDDPSTKVVWCQVSRENGSFNDSYLRYMPDYGKRVRVEAC